MTQRRLPLVSSELLARFALARFLFSPDQRRFCGARETELLTSNARCSVVFIIASAPAGVPAASHKPTESQNGFGMPHLLPFSPASQLYAGGIERPSHGRNAAVHSPGV